MPAPLKYFVRIHKNATPAKITAGGKPKIIHSKKSGLCPANNCPTAIALGGDPMMVPMPPRFAATAIPKKIPRGFRSSGVAPAASGPNTAIIMAAVAVLDMNMLNRKVPPITQANKRVGRGPTRASSAVAICRSKPVLAQPRAKTKPPKNSQIKGDDHGSTNRRHASRSPAAACTPPGFPNNAISKPTTIKATENAAIASETHNKVANTKIPKLTCPAADKSSYHPQLSGTNTTAKATAPHTNTLATERKAFR